MSIYGYSYDSYIYTLVWETFDSKNISWALHSYPQKFATPTFITTINQELSNIVSTSPIVDLIMLCGCLLN